MIILLAVMTGRSPFGRKNSSFAVKPGSEITRIELLEGEKKLTLEKKEDEWLVNGKEQARKNRIILILDVLNEMKIKSPVSKELFKQEIADKGIEPVRVRVFQGRRLLKSFLVFKTSSNSFGNIMKIREMSKPFIMNLPGTDREIGSL
ncbi:MAG: hypothetical protein HPY62_03415, partial [Bacteroidales bacterium]|nr:hypothetical protein [Bacteroidales bacterium]